jgi:hypothetical protein
MIKNPKDQLILLSTPNSGSDWFSNILAEKEEKKYFREFFNPITNEKYTDLLANSFGCELVSTYKNIASQNLADCETTYNNTWKKENFNFTKENYSVFKIPFFVKKFNCIALTRRIENSFPPNRKNEVFCWYESIYCSMIKNIDTLPKKTKLQIENSIKNNSIVHKILMCFQIYQESLIDYCTEYKIPIVRWEILMKEKKDILIELEKTNLKKIEIIANSIIETRKFKTKDFKKYNFNN